MPQVTVNVPDVLLTRVVAAFRATYPSLTDTLPDAQAAKVVLRHLVRSIVAEHEIAVARGQAAAITATAETQAWTGTETIT